MGLREGTLCCLWNLAHRGQSWCIYKDLCHNWKSSPPDFAEKHHKIAKDFSASKYLKGIFANSLFPVITFVPHLHLADHYFHGLSAKLKTLLLKYRAIPMLPDQEPPISFHLRALFCSLNASFNVFGQWIRSYYFPKSILPPRITGLSLHRGDQDTNEKGAETVCSVLIPDTPLGIHSFLTGEKWAKTQKGAQIVRLPFPHEENITTENNFSQNLLSVIETALV